MPQKPVLNLYRSKCVRKEKNSLNDWQNVKLSSAAKSLCLAGLGIHSLIFVRMDRFMTKMTESLFLPYLNEGIACFALFEKSDESDLFTSPF